MKKCVLTIAAVVLVIAILAFCVFFGLDLGPLKVEPMKDGITLGLDLVGGSEITYEAVVPEGMNDEDLVRSMDAVQAMLRERLNSLGYTEASVYLNGRQGVTVEIPNVTNPEQAVQMLGATAVIQFMDVNGNVIVDGRDIESATAAYLPSGTGGVYEYVVTLKLTEEGHAKFRDGTKAVANLLNEDLYIKLYKIYWAIWHFSI